jgi:diaminopimelate decarboxylase
VKATFGHPPEVLAFWRKHLSALLKEKAPTPFYFFSIVPIEEALEELARNFQGLPMSHWLSFKTQPLKPLVQWWNEKGLGIEVVSEFEFRAALKEGFVPGRILINGPAKHLWLRRYSMPDLRVNFDSAAEAKALLPLAKRHNWSCGVRLQTGQEFDPETPEYPTQFGLTGGEAVPLIQALLKAGLRMETVHFHLRTNVAEPAIYGRALREAAEICRAAHFQPLHVDLGGGFPPPHVHNRQGKPVAQKFSLGKMAPVYRSVLKLFPSVRQIWLENGRWLSARSGVLVTSVLDIKERRGMRHLICDGGRTMNALVSTWEEHALITIPPRKSAPVLTTVSGPTCMAFDQLTRRPLPRAIQPSDCLVWLEAGAYHLPWETRFSHGVAPVYWHDGRSVRLVRSRQSFEDWWGQWHEPSAST